MNDQPVAAPSEAPTKDALLAMGQHDYMNERQLAFFRQRLQDERDEIQARLAEIRASIASHERDSDEADQASFEEELRLSLRQADRESRLVKNIDAALKRIENGEYGFCEETGEPIGIARLLFRPTARLCIEAKERQERQETHFRKTRWE
ncbi:RNA polymerase-binding protein DksA [Halomonas sp. HMF6819]|uniref:RNA polymerase-binding protein DksA n=1 Tax=unclassified Halomonas TaxID=2609666 RepID=UPI0020769AD1